MGYCKLRACNTSYFCTSRARWERGAAHAARRTLMSIVATLRERLLALGTGGFAGIVVSYYASRDVWQHAHDHGVLIDSAIEELRDLQGYERPPPPQARAPFESSGGVAPSCARS